MSCRLPWLCAIAAFMISASPTAAQDVPDRSARVVRLVAQPAALTLRAGETVTFEVFALDAAGERVDTPIRVAAPRAALRYADGRLTALVAGDHEVVATLVTASPAAQPLTIRIPVHVDWPRIARIEIRAGGGRLYAGTTLPHTAHAFHADGSERPSPVIAWRTDNARVASVDAFGNVTAHVDGRVRITAELDGVTAGLDHRVERLEAVRLEIRGGSATFRTGDVQALDAVAVDAAGRTVPDVPVLWATTWTPLEFAHTGAGAPAQVRADGRFVADVPGLHTVVASAGPLSARRTFQVTPRDVVQKLTVVGTGSTSRFRTTDLWPFQGVDGRDYALTGSKVADGHAFVWDITDPANIIKTDSIQVDARTVNDVKVSPDGRYGVITREGASSRRNGVVILDLADPAHPTIASVFDQELTGGVHNAYATNDYLYAVSGGDKYVIIDVRDIRNPRYVSEYNHPDSRIHDVWVHDGIAYSAEWGTGVVVVDVGNGRWGGSPERPVFVTSFATPTGATHAVFPYRQASSGRTYLFVGDEIMTRAGLAMEGPPGAWSQRYDGGSYAERYDAVTGGGGVPLATRGYIQIFDFTDPENPGMVARYEVTEYGTHNIWVEGDKLYQAYYEGGLRVVDVSGELLGNLYTQGREIAVFRPFDPEGYVANSPMVWSAIPYKDHVFFADTNSGIWAVKIQPRARPVS